MILFIKHIIKIIINYLNWARANRLKDINKTNVLFEMYFKRFYEKVQLTSVNSNSNGTEKFVRNSECSNYRMDFKRK